MLFFWRGFASRIGYAFENLNKDADKSLKFVRYAGAIIAGLILGSLLGIMLFHAPAIGAIFGVVFAVILQATGRTPVLFSKLDTDNNRPIYAAALAIVGLLLLINLADLRIQRTVIEGWDLFAIILAAVASLVVLRGLMVALWRVWATGILGVVNRSTMDISAMVFVILIGASLFSLVFRVLAAMIPCMLFYLVYQVASSVPFLL